jgi:hypothetical protein
MIDTCDFCTATQVLGFVSGRTGMQICIWCLIDGHPLACAMLKEMAMAMEVGEGFLEVSDHYDYLDMRWE